MADRHLSLNEVAYQAIREKIIQGEFNPGCRIREDHLADEISMSRTPVREAINRLVSDGLIINKARKGLYLIDPSREEFESYLDIRIALEKLSVEQCIDRIEEEGLMRISEALDEFGFRMKNKKYDLCNQLDGEFHLLIAEISENKKLYTILDELSSFFLQTRSLEKKENPDVKNIKTLREHRIIYEAIRNKDKVIAKEALFKNIDTMRDNLHLQ
ncbi:GntR family transcriptional regulator [Oceanispirochaeta sp.]|jgi:DNA-binding GntR family transcriptional regulator|uniref:GntR family transcriptional regulator n=1 Tax=Oceanispirochaeta sp. TaxID=2035350 RepID=UPI002631ECCD|nr:GntR family transcriptional regulator [Oceanispirochaeta sp.]MDA3959110.1 GntR family transcriptional regulator [Oceanispirochaeta sp.]